MESYCFPINQHCVIIKTESNDLLIWKDMIHENRAKFESILET